MCEQTIHGLVLRHLKDVELEPAREAEVFRDGRGIRKEKAFEATLHHAQEDAGCPRSNGEK